MSASPGVAGVPDPVLAGLAARHGLIDPGARQGALAYLREIWSRRAFIVAFSRARMVASYSGTHLGRWWQLLSPLLNAAVYFLVFGLVLKAKRGIPDYVPFLVTGVFTWAFLQGSVTAGVKAVTGNLGLVRTLHFPRASLPLALCLQQAQQLLYSMGVLLLILLACGQRPRLSWVLVLPALALQLMLAAGLTLAVARAGTRLPDLGQLLPFALRTWMYISGVMYSLHDKLADAPHLVQQLAVYNPAALCMDLMRLALIDTFGRAALPPFAWLVMLGWAVIALGGGFIYFWRGEREYGRG